MQTKSTNGNQRTMKTSELVRRFLPYFRPYRGMLALDLFCATLTTLCDLVLPMIVRSITGLASGSAAALTVVYVLKVGGVYVLLRLIDTVANYIMVARGHVMGTYIERDMRHALFEHLQEMGFAYYSNAKVGQIMARITSDLFDVTEFAHHCPEEFLIAAIKITVPFVILLGINPVLTVIIFLMLPIMLVLARYFNKKMRAAFKESRHQVGEINAQVEDSLLGIRVVKSFANEPMEIDKFDRGNEEFVRIGRRKYRYMAGYNTTTRSFDGVMYIVVVIVGALFIIDGKITAADYMAYLLYISTLLTSIRRVVDYAEQFQRGMTGIERFCEIMDVQPDVNDAPGAKELTGVKGDVTFDHVSFHYNDNDRTVLADINETVKAGDKIALVGPSGGGKTTFCNLIPRFYDVSGGRILIDGQDIAQLTQRSLRENIGMVQQEVYMFSGTIYENIAYGLPGATREQVETAAKQAGADGFIRELPDGYDTYVGERGVKLSGGQKQRISIARVFLKNPPILILDEATSALDNESEILVGQSLEKLAHGRTTLTIAHRLTTIKDYDRILVLGEEGVVEEGTHAQLLAKQGVYYRLWNQLPGEDTL